MRHTGKNGRTNSPTFETAAAAAEYRRLGELKIATVELTTETALEEFESHLVTVGMSDRGPCKPKSAKATCAIVRRFFARPRAIHGIGPALIAELYAAIAGRMKADSHRNILLQVRTFLRWCTEVKGYYRKNPADGVKGVGKRSKGKQKLSIKETRAWLPLAMRLAQEGDIGAVAALMALLMGLRASEIVERRVRDVDELEEPGDTLNVPEGKNESAQRLLEVPAELRPFLAALAEGKPRDAWLFPAPKSADGKHDYGWVRAQVKRICGKADVTKVCAHAMRGKFAEIANRQRAPNIGAYGGWSDERTQHESYAGKDAVAAGERQEALRLLQGGKK